MIEFTFLLSLYAALISTYLLGRRVKVWYHTRRYRQILKEAKTTPAPLLEEIPEEPGVILPYEREFVDRESVEEREWRVEQEFLEKKGQKQEEEGAII